MARTNSSKLRGILLGFSLVLSSSLDAQTTNGSWQDMGSALPAIPFQLGNVLVDVERVGNLVYVAGGFNDLGGVPDADNIAVWNGVYWNGVGGGLYGQPDFSFSVVTVMLAVGNDLYVGGDFVEAGGVPGATHIAKWNGTSWEALGNGLNGTVYALLNIGNDIYAGGEFEDAGGIPNADYIAKWNGTSWDSVSLGLNGAVLALATRDSILYAAGNFSNAGGDTLADQVAKWDGSSWSALGSGFKGYNPPRTLAFFDDKLYTFRAADGTLLAEDFFGVWNDTTWEVAKNPSPFIQKLVSAADKLYICHTGGIITWDGSSFENVSPQLNGLINDVATSGNDLFVVGFAENIGNHPYGDNVAKWDGSSWSALGSGLNGSVETVAISGNEIYVGGTFTDAGGNPNADHIAKWNGSSWEALGTGLNNTVNEIVIRDGDVYVSGIFTDAGGNANADGIAKWNGTSWEAFGTGVNSTLYTEMAISGSNIYITGIFASAGNVSGADYVAKWNGSSWEAMPGLGVVNARAIAVLGEKVFLGGNFGLISEWNGSAWQTLSTGLNGTVNAIAVSGNNLYIGGAFTNAGGNSSADYLTKWNGASFEPVPGTLNASVKQLMVNGDDLYVYGNFLNAGNNLSADRLARFDGATWYSVGLLDGSEDFLALTMDGYDMVVGGSWTGIEGTIMPNIARWHHEIPQPTIQPTSLSFHNATVSSVQISFTAASGNPRGYLVLRKSGGAPTGSPVDETEYFPGQTLGDAVVAYNGSLTHFTDVTVTPGNVYHYAVFSYNGTGQATNYLTTNPLRSNTIIGIVSTAVAANTVSTQTATGSAYPSGFPDQAWRMFSVPVNLTDKSVSSILSDFGEPGNSTWRLFEGTMDASSTAQLQPGKAYWLKQIHIPGGKQVTLGAGMTASVSDATLVLTPGWNQISNPFAFPIDWNNNTDAGGNINIKGPIAFDGSKYIGLGQTKGDNTSFTTLNPFDGYYVYNAASTNQSLTIDPTGAYPKTIAKVTASYMDADWLIQVGVKNGKFEDQFNYIGAAQDAAYGEDRYDLPELPVIGEYVSVSFDHTSNDRTVPYTIDCHKNGLEGYTWDMSVRTNLEGENVLNWNPDRVPANFIVKIMNVSNREIVETQDYLFKSRTEDQPVRFKVWVGTVTYVENASNSFVDELPTSFALSQNYPNPFNPSTTIRFDVAKAGTVKLTVYNLLGQEVRTLANKYFEPGRNYAITWDGNDNKGKHVASGVYLYRMQAGTFSKTRKMMFLK